MDPIATRLGAWSVEIGAAAVIFRILLSVALAAVIGCERSSKRHSAGLRTFILVSLASTVAMLLDIYLSSQGDELYIISAATVIAAAIISVNSMLFSSRNQIKGLTTSMGLWATGIIGLTAGAGLYTVTLVSFAALLCCLSLFPAFETYLKNRSNHFEVHLELNPAYVNSGLSVYSIAISIDSAELKKYKTHKEIIEALKTLDYIYHIEEMHG